MPVQRIKHPDRQGPTLAVRLTPRIAEAMQRIVESRGTSYSQIARDALIDYLRLDTEPAAPQQ